MWLPGEGTDVAVARRRILPPGPREGIVSSLPEHRLYFYPKPKRGHTAEVFTYPVSIGRMDWRSPLGETHVMAKEVNPSWYPPESIRKEHAANGDPLPVVVPPGPKTRFGVQVAPGGRRRHVRDSRDQQPGCRGSRRDPRLHSDVSRGHRRFSFGWCRSARKVRLLSEPVKVAYVDGELTIEVHPPSTTKGSPCRQILKYCPERLEQLLNGKIVAIRWDLARAALNAATGMPTLVGLEANYDPTAATSSQNTGR